MKEKKCVICGFDKKVEKHHIIKRKDFGSNSEDNLVYLCLNHHWIGDFGSDEDKKIIISQILEITGKYGSKINESEIEYLNKKARFLLAQTFDYLIEDETEWGKMLETSNYDSIKNWLVGVGVSKEYSQKLNQKAEMLILINKLMDNLPKT